MVTRNLPPLVGGMEQLNWHMADELAKTAEVSVIGPAGSGILAPAKVRVQEAPLKPLWKFLLRARTLAIREAKTWKPDVVLAGSGLTAPIALHAAHTCATKAAVYVHGLDVAARHPLYRAIWLPAIRRMDRVIANSQATATLCRSIGVDPGRIDIVHPGVAIPQNPPDPQAISRFRVGHDLGARPLLLSVGRLTERKGLREFVAQALPRIKTAYPDVLLLVVGNAPEHSLHAKAQTPASIQATANNAGLADNLRFLGVITDRERLASIYEAADVHVFPVRTIPNDPEGFGMVAVEAAAHGLPTVAFATGGVIDAVAEGKSGHLVEPDNYDTFADAVVQTLAARDAMRSDCTAFAQRFAWTLFGEKVASLLCDSTWRPTAASATS